MRAGLELLQEGGYEAFTIAEVSRRGRVSVGSVYGRFENKRTLFLAIHRRYLDAMAAGWSLSSDDAEALGTPELIRRVVGEVVGEFEQHGAALRVFMRQAGTDADVYAQAQVGISRLAERFKGALEARVGEYGHPQPEVAVDVAFHMVFGTAARRVTYGPALESGLELSWERLSDELGIACVAYLMGPR